MILLTDRPDQSAKLQRLLSLWGPCTIADARALPRKPRAAERLLIVDLDLSGQEAVSAARAAIAKARAPGVPMLHLLRTPSARAEAQANALGARRVLPAQIEPRRLLDEVDRMLDTAGTASPAMRQNFIAASVGVGEVLSQAAAGKPLPMVAVRESVEAINRAADDLHLDGWLSMVWNHDDRTYQHCLLVAGLAAAFSRRLGFSEEARRLVTAAALLHDIGKARIAVEILNKPGALSPDELLTMRQHPVIGYDMLKSQGGFDEDVIAAARSHHEYLDGSGYPQGLAAAQIPDVVRMVTICDIYAALVERRAYREVMAPEAAYNVLAGMKGKLDPDLLRAFRAVVLPQ